MFSVFFFSTDRGIFNIVFLDFLKKVFFRKHKSFLFAHNDRIISGGKNDIIRVNIIRPPEKLTSLSQSRNHCCAMVYFNFVMLIASKNQVQTESYLPIYTL